MAVGAFEAGDVDYLSTVTPRSLPTGLDVEVVSADALRLAGREAAGADRAHVTSWLYTQPGRCRVAGLVFAPKADDLRVTLDTPEDADLLDGLVPLLPGVDTRPPRWDEVVVALRAHPDLAARNAHIEKKPLAAG
jgi:spore coat polysaccharide biosynthesis protein SpsF